MTDIISRKEAKAQGLKRYFTGKPCKHGHISERLVTGGSCVECNRVYYTKNRNKRLEYGKKYRDENLEKCRELVRSWQRKNPKKALESAKQWRSKNPEKHRNSQRQSSRRHRQKINSATAKRRAAKLNAMPNWADRSAINAVYAQAKLAEAITGLPHHVDHIVPLQGKNVCGLHVENNLQILPYDENCSKGNKFF